MHARQALAIPLATLPGLSVPRLPPAFIIHHSSFILSLRPPFFPCLRRHRVPILCGMARFSKAVNHGGVDHGTHPTKARADIVNAADA